jgi:hypothetical protein
MFQHIVRADRTLLFLNVLLLLAVAFLPFPTAVLAHAFQDGADEKVAFVFYGATLVLGGVFLNAIWQYARREHRFLGAHISPEEARRIGQRVSSGRRTGGEEGDTRRRGGEGYALTLRRTAPGGVAPVRVCASSRVRSYSVRASQRSV